MYFIEVKWIIPKVNNAKERGTHKLFIGVGKPAIPRMNDINKNGIIPKNKPAKCSNPGPIVSNTKLSNLSTAHSVINNIPLCCFKGSTWRAFIPTIIAKTIKINNVLLK